ncbi:MAG: hypothetical protein ACREVE_02270 [Gammaproteobacteria bacterium]
MKLLHRFRAAAGALACAKLLALSLYPWVASAAPSITWRPDAINREIPAGATVALRASFVASEEIQDATLRVVPSLAHYVQAVQIYPEAGATIQPNDPARVVLNVSIPRDVEPVTFSGVVQLKSAGKSNKTYAKPLPVTLGVRAHDEGLPPDPGEAGKATLLGIDSNDNGIRDDVERYIVLENRDNPEIIPLLLNYAALTQDEFRRHAQGVAQPEGHLERALLNLDCIDYVDPSQGGERVLAMIDVVTNTPERWITKLKIDKEIAGGKGISIQKVSEEECRGMLVFPSK